MKTTPLDRAVQMFEEVYGKAIDPSVEEWSKTTIALGLSLSDNAYTRSDRIALITSSMIKTLDASTRLELENEIDFSGPVRLALSQEAPWPEVLSVDDFTESSSEDILEYRVRKVTTLRSNIEEASKAIITGGDRMVLTNAFLGVEAGGYLDAHEDPDITVVDEHYPHIQFWLTTHPYLDGMVEAATEVFARSLSWRQANSSIEVSRVTANVTIEGAADVEAVNEAYDLCLSEVDGIVAALLAASV